MENIAIYQPSVTCPAESFKQNIHHTKHAKPLTAINNMIKSISAAL